MQGAVPFSQHTRVAPRSLREMTSSDTPGGYAAGNGILKGQAPLKRTVKAEL